MVSATVAIVKLQERESLLEDKPSNGYELNGFKTVFLDRRLPLIDRAPLGRSVRVSNEIHVVA